MLFANNEFVEMFINVYLASFVNTLVPGVIDDGRLFSISAFSKPVQCSFLMKFSQWLSIILHFHYPSPILASLQVMIINSLLK